VEMCYGVDMKRESNTFGDWIRFQLHNHQITIINLSDYSGIHIRKLYRIINGENKLYHEDWIWLVECIGDMTDQPLTECVNDCVQYMNPPK
jgi:predicted transcriptional regulator